MTDSETIRADDIVKIFGSGRTAVRAVDGVSMSVETGELVMIMGPSGSGKTTLVSILGTLLTADSGTIVIDGVDISTLDEPGIASLRARKIGFVFQSFNLLEALTARQNILMPATLAPGGRQTAEAHADALLDRLGLASRRNVLPGTLSGGEKQRVAIARALINGPRLIFADEPTGNLDSQSGQEVMMILHDIARDTGCAVVLVTHDQRVMDVADRVLWLEDGQLRDRKTEPRNWVRDPVCGMRIDEWTAEHHSSYRGRRYAFCSRRCAERFEAGPETYIGDDVADGPETNREES